MIDDSVISLVKDELEEGEKPADIIEKLRKIGYSDDDIEKVFAKIRPNEVTIINRPSRPTVFKTIFSVRVLGIIALIIILVAGLYYLSIYLGVTESVAEKAKRSADATPEAILFTKSIELQNAVISCIPQVNSNYSNYVFCTAVPSNSVSDLGGGKFEIEYLVDESPKCPKNYIKQNSYLKVSVDLMQSTTHSVWLLDPPFNQDLVNSLYSKKDNCNALGQYVAQFVNDIEASEDQA